LQAENEKQARGAALNYAAIVVGRLSAIAPHSVVQLCDLRFGQARSVVAPRLSCRKPLQAAATENPPGLTGPSPTTTFAHTNMTTKTPPAVDLLFRALADRTRLRILHLLSGGEVCVCDLVTVLEVPQPTASRHLAYLRKAGLVTARKDGYWSYYSLSAPRGELHTKLLECVACCRHAMPEMARDAKLLGKCARKGCCE